MKTQVEKLEVVETELEEAYDTMVMNLPEKLKELEVTEEELTKLREELKDEAPDVLAEAEETFHIRKKLNYLVNDYNVFKQIEAAIEVLQKSKEYHEGLDE